MIQGTLKTTNYHSAVIQKAKPQKYLEKEQVFSKGLETTTTALY